MLQVVQKPSTEPLYRFRSVSLPTLPTLSLLDSPAKLGDGKEKKNERISRMDSESDSDSSIESSESEGDSRRSSLLFSSLEDRVLAASEKLADLKRVPSADDLNIEAFKKKNVRFEKRSIGGPRVQMRRTTGDHRRSPSEQNISVEKLKAKNDPNVEEEARRWMEDVLGAPLVDLVQVDAEEKTMGKLLKSGVILCKLINAIKPNSVKKINTSSNSFMQMENINNFLVSCASLGFPQSDLFVTTDLFEEKDVKGVIFAVHALGRHYARLVPGYSGPVIGGVAQVPEKKGSPQFKRRFKTLDMKEIERLKELKEQRDREKAQQAQMSELTPRSREAAIAASDAKQNASSELSKPQLSKSAEQSSNEDTGKKQEQPFQSIQDDLKKMKEEIDGMKTERANTSKKIQAERDQLQKERDQFKAERNESEASRQKLEKENAALQTQIAALRKEHEHFKKAAQDKEVAITEKMKSYKKKLEELKALRIEEIQSNNAEIDRLQQIIKRHEDLSPRSESPESDANSRHDQSDEDDTQKRREQEEKANADLNRVLQSKTSSLNSEQMSSIKELLSMDAPLESNFVDELPTTPPSLTFSPSSLMAELNELTETDQHSFDVPDELEKVLNLTLNSKKMKKYAGNMSVSKGKKKAALPPPESDSDDDMPPAYTNAKAKDPKGSMRGSMRNRAPSFVSKLFSDPSITQNEEPDQDGEDVEASKEWTRGDDIVKDFAVKEDANKKGMRRTKRRTALVTGGNDKDMEDRNFAASPWDGDAQRGLFCIFDGHGGAKCAQGAVDHFPEVFQNEIGSLNDDLTDAFKSTYKVLDFGPLRQYEYEGATSTTVFIWEHDGKRFLQSANVGDSAAYLKANGEVIRLSRDHKPTMPEERDRMAAMGIEVLKDQTRVGGLCVSRALGDHFLKQENLGCISEPYVSPPVELPAKDSILVLASDGLWDVMTGEEALDYVSKYVDEGADSMCRRLLQTATANQKCTDNITIIVVTF